LFRLAVAPNPQNGLEEPSRLSIDKFTTMSITKIGARVGRLGDEDLLRLDRALLVFLGLAGAPSAKRNTRAPAG